MRVSIDNGAALSESAGIWMVPLVLLATACQAIPDQRGSGSVPAEFHGQEFPAVITEPPNLREEDLGSLLIADPTEDVPPPPVRRARPVPIPDPPKPSPRIVPMDPAPLPTTPRSAPMTPG